jgi:hypothetical protein
MKKSYESPTVTVITIDETNRLLSGSGKKKAQMDVDWTDGGDVDSRTAGQQSDENHTGNVEGENNMFGY